MLPVITQILYTRPRFICLVTKKAWQLYLCAISSVLLKHQIVFPSMTITIIPTPCDLSCYFSFCFVKFIPLPLKESCITLVIHISDQIRWDLSLSRVGLFATPWIAARQASLSITNSRSSLRLTSIESVMPSSHLILCSPLLLLPPIPPSIRVFSNESALHKRWPKYWSFSFSIISYK